MSNILHDILASYAMRPPTWTATTTDPRVADLLAALTKIKTHSRDAAIRQIAANAIAKAEL